jgi:hypothetical protein
MDEFDGYIECMDIPDEFKEVQQSIDSFVRIDYGTAQTVTINMEIVSADIPHWKGKILDIIRNNPPLASVPRYFRDGREDYLWYSDFYDEITKDVYHRYRTFVKPACEITSANYAEELEKIDLPYFKELIDLVSLEHLCMDYEERKEELPSEEPPIVELHKPKPESKQRLNKRSYEPKLNNKQYTLLVECIETIKLFRLQVNIAQLKKLLKGKLTEPLQVTNQKSLVYLLDQLKEHKYIKEAWVSVAEANKDFISFRTSGNEQRYGSEPHYITMQQLINSRNRNQKEAIHGLIEIEEMIELIEENRDK